MARKEATVSSGPMALFKKRPTFATGGGILRSRSSTWSVSERFKSYPIEEFVIEELGNKSGNLVNGPASVFNGQVSMNVKSRLPRVIISVTFRGLTEYNGHQLAFFNVTDDLWTGDLETGPKTFSFSLKFPPVNLPPSSNEPYIQYNFVAQIKPVPRSATKETANLPTPTEPKTYTSKPHILTFMPYVDPFAKSRFDIPDEPVVRKFPVEAMPSAFPIEPPQAMERSTGGRPMLKLTTDLPPSPAFRSSQLQPREISKPKNSGVEKSAIIMDGHNRILGKLKVVTEKSKFVPGDEVNLTITLTLPKGTPVPKQVTARIVERRTLGFEEDEDADQDVEGSDGENKHRKTSSGKIFSRTLTSKRHNLAKTAKPKPIENRPMTASSNRTGLEGYTLESGIEVTETLSVRIPTFKTFIDDSLLPSASLPLGPAYKDIALALPVHSPLVSNSIKGKEPMRPSTPQGPYRPHTANSTTKSSSVVHGLHYIVAHALNVQVPLTSGLIRKSSGTLDVDLELFLGNKRPDVYSYQSQSPNGSMEVLKMSTPELVVVPPGEGAIPEIHLRHSDSRTSFERKPSPLRNMGSFDAREDVSPGAAGSTQNGNVHGQVRTHSRPVSLRAASSRVSFRSFEPPEIQWKKGERFPTLNEVRERPSFWTHQ